MEFFGSTDTVDGKARNVLGDLPEDPSPFEILRTVDQNAGDDVDPDEVVSTMRDLDDTVDAKLATVEGEDVDQKAMRDAAGAVSGRTGLAQDDALQLLSTVVDVAEASDSQAFVDDFDDAVADLGDGNVDQNAQTDDSPSDMSDADTSDSTDPGAPDDESVDQKQDDGGDGDMNPIDLVEEIGGSDARDTVENYAESVGKDVEDAAAEWVAENVPGVTVEGYGSDGGGDAPEGGTAPTEPEPGADMNGPGHDRSAPDQKADDLDINERVAEAVTSDEVLDEMAGAVAQKMATDDNLADQLVETVDQKGDFATTDDTVPTASGTDSTTVGEAGAVTGGDDE
jgi:hypothetical protein